MTPLKKANKNPLINNKGFTLLEIVIVSSLISVLAAIALINIQPFRQKAFDTAARSDARYLVESVVIATLNDVDVKYTKIDESGAIGILDTSDNSRSPIFTLSKGVFVRIVGGSNVGLNGTTLLQGVVYHINGTDDTSASGKREFYCEVNEASDVTIAPGQ